MCLLPPFISVCFFFVASPTPWELSGYHHNVHDMLRLVGCFLAATLISIFTLFVSPTVVWHSTPHSHEDSPWAERPHVRVGHSAPGAASRPPPSSADVAQDAPPSSTSTQPVLTQTADADLDLLSVRRLINTDAHADATPDDTQQVGPGWGPLPNTGPKPHSTHSTEPHANDSGTAVERRAVVEMGEGRGGEGRAVVDKAVEEDKAVDGKGVEPVASGPTHDKQSSRTEIRPARGKRKAALAPAGPVHPDLTAVFEYHGYKKYCPSNRKHKPFERPNGFWWNSAKLVPVNRSLDNLLETVRRVAVNNTVVVVQANYPMKDLVANMMCQFRRLNLTNILFWCIDSKIVRYVQSMRYPLFYDPTILDLKHTNARVCCYGVKMQKILLARPPFLRTLLQQGFSVLFADADTSWSRNPLPYFGYDVDFEIQQDLMAPELELSNWWDVRAQLHVPQLCAGFYLVRPSARTIRFYDLMEEYFPFLMDQEVMNILFSCSRVVCHVDRHKCCSDERCRDRVVTVRSLDFKSFPNGHVFVNRSKAEGMLRANEEGPVVVHINGFQNTTKQKVMRSLGMWRLDDELCKDLREAYVRL